MPQDPERWTTKGTSLKLTASLRDGARGVPALPMHQPFAGWVARGWRRMKYLDYWAPKGELPRVCYLYASAKVAPDCWFSRDADDLVKVYDTDDAVEKELSRRRNDPASNSPKAIVGVALLAAVYDPGSDAAWDFAAGALLPIPIPLTAFINRPYGGVFYPFGR